MSKKNPTKTEEVAFDGPAEPKTPLGAPWAALQDDRAHHPAGYIPEPLDEPGEPWPMNEPEPEPAVKQFAPPPPQEPLPALRPATGQLITRPDLLHELAVRSVSFETKLGYEEMAHDDLLAGLIRNAASGSWVHVVAYAAMLAEVGATKGSLRGRVVVPAGEFVKLQDDLTEALEKVDAMDLDAAQRAEDLKARDAIIDSMLLGLTRVTGHVPPPFPPCTSVGQELKYTEQRVDLLIEHIRPLVHQAAFNEGQAERIKSLEKENADLKAAHDGLVDDIAESNHQRDYVDQDRQDWKDQAVMLGKVLLQVTKPN